MNGHLHLTFPASSLDIAEAIAIHLAGTFRFRLREETGAEGTQNAIRKARIFSHDIEGLLPLGHGTLTQNLSGEDEIETLLLHPSPGDPKHQRVAVDARIHVPSEAVTGRPQHLQVLFGDIEHDERQAYPLRCRPRFRCAEKRRFKGDSQDLDTLFLDDFEGQDAIQTS